MANSKLTCELLIDLLSSLPKNQPLTYINDATHTVVAIADIARPYGPITILRWNPSKGESAADGTTQTISSAMLYRVANAFTEGTPINFDRLLGASYNTRSALESLMCHLPPFYYCYPGRIENKGGVTKIKAGHKHVVWLPNDPHAPGILVEKKLEHLEIDEIPAKSVIYNALECPTCVTPKSKSESQKAQVERIHSLKQMSLYEIGKALGFDTCIDKYDAGIKYKGIPLSDHPRIVKDLSDSPLVSPHEGAVKNGQRLDVIWLSKRSIPAVFEIEHSTGVTSGLNRMLGFKNALPEYSKMRFVIVADDDLRDRVVQEINRSQFAELQAKFMPYSAVNELFNLCQERKLKGITEDFIDTFLEDVFVSYDREDE